MPLRPPLAVEKGDADEPDDHALGRSRGGFGSKIHLVTDGTGLALAVVLTGGQVAEVPCLQALLAAVRPDRSPTYLIGDRAYSSRAARVAADAAYPPGHSVPRRSEALLALPHAALQPAALPSAQRGRAVRRLAQALPQSRQPLRQARPQLPGLDQARHDPSVSPPALSVRHYLSGSDKCWHEGSGMRHVRRVTARDEFIDSVRWD